MIAVIEASEDHVTATGASHSYINQNVTTTGTPTFTNVTVSDVNLSASASSGINFWNSNNYSINMSTYNDGGRLDSTSDYNMYFNMASGTNRGYVFKYNGSPIAQFDGSGNLLLTGTVDGVDIAGSINQAVLTTSSPTFSSLTLTNGLNLTDGHITNIETIEFNNTSNYIIKLEDDTDTGIYYDVSSNQWSWRLNGSQKAYIDLDDGNFWTDGNVDCDGLTVGTSTPITGTEEGTGDNDKITTKGYVDGLFIAAGSGDVVGPSSSTDNNIARFSGITGKVIQESGGATIADTGIITSSGLVSNGQATMNYGISLGNSGQSGNGIHGDSDGNVYIEGQSNNVVYMRPTVGINNNMLRLNTDGLTFYNGSGSILGVSIDEFSNDGTFAGNSDDAVPTEKATKTYVDGKIATSNTMPYAYKTATYTATTNDGMILCNGTFTVNTPSGYKVGQVLTIKNWGTGTITINPDSSDKIDGSTSNVTLSGRYSFIQILRAGDTDWIIIGGGTYLS